MTTMEPEMIALTAVTPVAAITIAAQPWLLQPLIVATWMACSSMWCVTTRQSGS
jgi:hypothetical protein